MLHIGIQSYLKHWRKTFTKIVSWNFSKSTCNMDEATNLVMVNTCS
jgi:hypothetical protein